MIRVPASATRVARYVARVEGVSGRSPRRWLELKMWCSNVAAAQPLVESQRFGAVSPDGDLRASIREAFGAVTFRGDVARVGAAVEAVTFVLDGSERAIVAPATASSPGIVTLARSAAG